MTKSSAIKDNSTCNTNGLERLQELSNPPLNLYQRGVSLESHDLTNSVAIVGSRNVSQEGIDAARKFAKNAAEAGKVVISGLAKGIDTAVFEGAMEVNGKCIIVLPSSVDEITPRANEKLALQILENGGTIISEQPIGSPVMKYMFVQRNRLIAALSDTVYLGEAKDKGGAWYTVRSAWKLNRPTYRLNNDGSTSPLVNPQKRLFDD
jgi:DNA processing protein